MWRLYVSLTCLVVVCPNKYATVASSTCLSCSKIEKLRRKHDHVIYLLIPALWTHSFTILFASVEDGRLNTILTFELIASAFAFCNSRILLAIGCRVKVIGCPVFA